MNSVTDVEKLYTEAFSAATHLWLRATTFRKISLLGLPAATKQIHEENVVFASSFLSDPAYFSLFTSSSSREEFSKLIAGPEGLGTRLTTGQLDAYRYSIDAASLLFVHSLVDAAVTDCCRVSAFAAPDLWEPFLAERKVTLGAVKNAAYATLLKDMVEAHVGELERQALAQRAFRLFQVCKPSQDFVFKPTYRYDEARLLNLDDVCHKLVHGPPPAMLLANGDDDLEYLFDTSLFFIVLVGRTHGLRVLAPHFFGGGHQSKPYRRV